MRRQGLGRLGVGNFCHASEMLGPPGRGRAWNFPTQALRHASAKLGPPGRGSVWNCAPQALRHASAKLGPPVCDMAWNCAAQTFRHASENLGPPGRGRSWNFAAQALRHASAQLGPPGRSYDRNGAVWRRTGRSPELWPLYFQRRFPMCVIAHWATVVSYFLSFRPPPSVGVVALSVANAGTASGRGIFLSP